MTDNLARLNHVSVPCELCKAFQPYGRSKHTLKRYTDKVILRCVNCRSGWAIDLIAIPLNAPTELIIQSMTNCIVNKQATLLEPVPHQQLEQ